MRGIIARARVCAGFAVFASAGTGTITHLTVELFMANAKISMLHVPYKGGAPALVAFLSGQVQAIFSPIAEILPHMLCGNRQAALL